MFKKKWRSLWFKCRLTWIRQAAPSLRETSSEHARDMLVWAYLARRQGNVAFDEAVFESAHGRVVAEFKARLEAQQADATARLEAQQADATARLKAQQAKFGPVDASSATGSATKARRDEMVGEFGALYAHLVKDLTTAAKDAQKIANNMKRCIDRMADLQKLAFNLA